MPLSTHDSPSTTAFSATIRSRPAHLHRLSFELNEVDQGRAAFAKLYGDCSIEPTRGIPFSYGLTIVSYGSIHVSTNEFAGGGQVRVHTLNDVYTLACTIAGTVDGEQAGAGFAGVPGRGSMLFSPGLSGSLHMGSGHRARNITFERSALDAHFALLTGETQSTPLLFDVMLDVAQPRTAAIAGIAELFRQEIERPDPSLPALAALRDALFTAILTGGGHNATARLVAPAPRVAPACVRRAEEYIWAHAAELISLEDLVAVTGVPARSLQAAFQRFRGTSPMNFLRQRRLDLARQRFLDKSAHATVGNVIRELGLGSAGRFSVEYKQRFGESPSETIARVARR